MQFVIKPSRADYSSMLTVLQRRLTRLAGAQPMFFILNLLAYIGIGLAAVAWWDLWKMLPRARVDLGLVAGGGAVGVAFHLLMGWYKRRVADRFLFAPQGHFLRDRSVVIDERGVRLSTEYSERYYQWPGFIGIEGDRDNLYLMLDNAEPLILPKQLLGEAGVAEIRERCGR